MWQEFHKPIAHEGARPKRCDTKGNISVVDCYLIWRRSSRWIAADVWPAYQCVPKKVYYIETSHWALGICDEFLTLWPKVLVNDFGKVIQKYYSLINAICEEDLLTQSKVPHQLWVDLLRGTHIDCEHAGQFKYLLYQSGSIHRYQLFSTTANWLMRVSTSIQKCWFQAQCCVFLSLRYQNWYPISIFFTTLATLPHSTERSRGWCTVTVVSKLWHW